LIRIALTLHKQLATCKGIERCLPGAGRKKIEATMGLSLTLNLQGFGSSDAKTMVFFTTDDVAMPKEAGLNASAIDAITRLAAIEKFTGKSQSALVATGLSELPCEKLIVIGLGKADDLAKTDWVVIGGIVAGKLKAGTVSVVAAFAGKPMAASDVADLALGMRMRAYSFDRYKTKKKDDDESAAVAATLHVGDVPAVKKALKSRNAIADGINLARELVNEPPNVLNPEIFAKRAASLKDIGVDVEILGEKELKKLGMRALLGVGLGSPWECQVVIMRWNGAKDAKAQPVAFVGKGVTFDTGGISIKPAGGMEDMKGDMAGAACVTGLMHALAARKAKVNAIGVIGLVENMPDGKAQRPGDIVTSMSGQTIEIINTDAEGRLVLADVLWHTQAAFKPKFMVNLATLTGAIMVALGQEYAGLFSNNDDLSEKIFAAGKSTGERVWRMPLDPAYDKIIDSKFADVKNSGGRFAGSITAAQFLQRFVNDCPWAHLDVAGTAMAANQTEINRSWGPGWGVRLLNQLVSDHYEDK
jgi:leucyl aminopeptidase